ncbi:hypothetical protein ACNKHQ_25255 [Shigella flexneri]
MTGFGASCIWTRAIDGLVHVSSLDNDYYRFDKDQPAFLIGESGGQTYRLGNRVEVHVEAVTTWTSIKLTSRLISSEAQAA